MVLVGRGFVDGYVVKLGKTDLTGGFYNFHKTWTKTAP